LTEEIKLTEKERKQIIFQRRLGYGNYQVYLENGQPERFIQPMKTVKPGEVEEQS